ncbi:MAG: DUF3494 domain-containing protein [Saprospiraceae bacterium]|nr:DUF3494 domain-containing protein [Saprospiraceae bacterium]
MKKFLPFTIALFAYFIPSTIYSQVPDLGSTSGFVFFTAAGAFTVTGASVVTGDVGTDAGAFAAFPPGVLIGSSHVADALTAQAAADVLDAYEYLDGLLCTYVEGVTFGNGQILTPGVHCAGGASTLNGNLILDGQNNPNAVFIIQIDGAFASTSNSTVTLINGASICNIFWQINGAVELGINSFFRGNIIASGAISLLSGATIEGRALTTAGAIGLSDNVASICALNFSISCPAAISVTCSDDVPDPNFGELTVLGNCAMFSVDPDVILNFVCENNYSISRIYRANNQCGTISTCEQIITVLDAVAPTIICPPALTLICIEDVPAADTNIPLITDNCSGILNVTVTPDMLTGSNCATGLSLLRVYTVTDLCGNTGTCSQSMIIQDDIAPIITCPPTASVTCGLDFPVPGVGVITTDNCIGLIELTFDQVAIIGVECEVMRTYTATDICGNTATCEQIISVIDNVAPKIICAATLTVGCVGDAPVADISSAIVTDNCDPAVMVTIAPDVLSNITCENGFTITRLFTATDACGNIATCVQSIIVNDEEVPVISFCPPSITIACGTVLPPSDIELIVATDNCTAAGDLNVFSTDVFNGGNGCGASPAITSRIYTVQDACGNEATCVQTINMTDDEAPVITNCPLTVNLACVTDLIAGDVQLIVATDNCTITESLVITFDDFDNGGSGCNSDPLIIQRNYIVSDICGNTASCVQILNIVDDEAPVTINCPLEVTINCFDELSPGNTNLISVTDNCALVADPVIEVLDISNNGSGCASDPLIINRTFTVSDACGNSSVCNQLITVIDDVAPIIQDCPSDLQFSCIEDVPAGVELTVSDNCGNVVVSLAETNNGGAACISDPLIISRTYTATDACGFDCIEEVPVANVNLLIANDNCGLGNVSFIESNNGGSGCFTDPLIITRFYTVSDVCGNTATCDQIITIIDDEAPAISIQHPTLGILSNGEIISIQCESNTAGWNVEALLEGMAMVTDNCSQDASVEFTAASHISNECEADGYLLQMTYQWIASDNCGNTASFNVVIQVVDTIAPVLVGVPDDITVSCDSIPVTANALPCGTMAQIWSEFIIVIDECECAEVTFEEIVIEGNCQTATQILRIWTGTDNCGNTARDTQRVNVINNSGPNFTWTTDITGNIANGEILEVECFEGGLPAWVYELDFRSMKAVDACQTNSDLRVSFDYEFLGFGDCIADGYVQAYEFMWTATGICGIQGEYKIQIRLIDTTPPVIQNWQELVCPGPFLEDKWIIAESCSGVAFNVTESTVASICNLGQQDILRTLIVTDGCNNSAEYQQLVASSEEGPVFTWKGESFNNAQNGDTIELECGVMGANTISGVGKQDLLVSASCSPVLNVDFDEELIYEGDCTENGFFKTVKLTWTATDECLQTSVFELTINLMDNTAPVIHVQGQITVICGKPIPAPFVTDNCSEVSVRIEEISSSFADCPDYTTIQRNIIASDECGNISSMVQEITMTNIGFDMFAGIDQVICMTGMPVPALPVFTDPCTGEELIPEVRIEGIYSECGLPGTMRRTIILTNSCGIVSEMDQTILMRSQLFPELVIAHPVLGIIKDKTEFELECEDQEIEFNLRQARVINSCHGDEIRFEINEVYAADCKVDGFIKRIEYKWTASDICGNVTVFNIYVNYNDTQAPVFTNIPVNQQIICDDLPEVQAPDVYDLCTEVELTFSETRVDRNDAVNLIRTWVAEDECGNTATVSQEIEMISNSDLDCSMVLLDSIICNGDSIRITTDIDGPYYFWEVEGGACYIETGQGTSTITINVGFSEVTVRLRIIDNNGCLVICEQTFICESNEAFADLKNGTGNIQVTELFPNPADKEVSLRYKAERESSGKIRVYDLMGRTCFITNVDFYKGTHQLLLALNQLPSSGLYFLELESETVIETYRFMKN